MGAWSRDKVNSSNINSGNEYAQGDRVSRQNLNAMVNAGLYAQDFAEHLADTPDTSAAGTVGTPSVTLVDNIVGGKTYKKFKFSNLKGQTGATGNGIASISKTSTSGLVDTYTITFTNGNTTTFEVDNGDSVDMRINNGYFQWKRTQDTTWINLMATSAVANVDQTLDVNSTNAIANSAVATKFNNITNGTESVGKVTNGVYTTNFNKTGQTIFGSYIVEKKKRLFYSDSGQSISTETNITLSESINDTDVIEIVYKQQATNGIKHLRITGLSARITDFYYYNTNGATLIYFLNFPITISGNSMTINKSSTKVISLPNTEGGTVTQTVKADFNVTIYSVYKIIG